MREFGLLGPRKGSPIKSILRRLSVHINLLQHASLTLALFVSSFHPSPTDASLSQPNPAASPADATDAFLSQPPAASPPGRRASRRWRGKRLNPPSISRPFFVPNFDPLPIFSFRSNFRCTVALHHTGITSLLYRGRISRYIFVSYISVFLNIIYI